MRILVTGSRDWDDETTVRCELLLAAHGFEPRDVTLVSGACPTGADAIAERFAIEEGWTVERHPAEWNTHGKQAGFIRNSEMVNLGADVCVAFIKNNSRGATMTAYLCERSGIRLLTFWEYS